MADEEPRAVPPDPEQVNPEPADREPADPGQAGAETTGAAGATGEEAADRSPDGRDVDESGLDLFRPRTPVDDRWFDDEAGPVVRLFSMTRGRARPVEDGLFDLISLIVAKDPAPVAAAVPAHVLDPEHQTILAWCRREPISVAELGSYTDLPVSVVRVLLGDLHDAELISVTRPVPLAELPDERLLRDVINGLRAL
ncbi:DUF742 domain-containing protein [Kitasatospora purpeofusca]|uniref:DUF742 domain-containing protein n=1 Tax=Kitasatospora purpeofusca TaxID=67352 RepID=UPI002A5AE701|nr:DUF742 domain-containing protein [Kitasatospora purpeofusca]MDY0810936.1 DUF742 domain-containing protein [Kitasatospora purpeofusca]